MTISKALENEILRYHFVEQWRVGTIAAELGIHHSTVERVLSQAGLPKPERTDRASIIDPYLPFIHETLRQHPKLTAARLYTMVVQRGYPGGPSHFRQHIAQLRPKKSPEAYLPLTTLPGEQAQCDWGHFGHLEIGRARRALMAFVLVLSWSRRLFVRFYPGQRMSHFLHGHVSAFEQWQAVPRVILYDNLKSVVLERRGQAIRFHPTLLELSAHYRFEPRPVGVGRGNEKGRVERSIRYLRENFFAGRHWRDLDDLNYQALNWSLGHSLERRCPQDRSLTVGEAFEHERRHLLALPENPFPAHECVAVSAGKTPFIRFDLNDYSIPPAHVRKPLTVFAEEQHVRVLDGATEIACHRRSYGKGERIEDRQHLAELRASKQEARAHSGQDRLAKAVPATEDFLVQALARGQRLSTAVALLLQCLDEYGPVELNLAVAEVLSAGVPHPNAVRQALQRRREARDQPPPLPVALPDHPGARVRVRTPSLATYDTLQGEKAHDRSTDDDTD